MILAIQAAELPSPYFETLPYQERNDTTIKVLVAPVNFADALHPCGTLENLYSFFVNGTLNVSENLWTMSRGHIRLHVDFAGPYTLPQFQTNSTCVFNDIHHALLPLLSDLPLSLSDYHVLSILTPPMDDCSAGVAGAFTDCLQSSAVKCWHAITVCTADNFLHELGHNLNMGHAGLDLDNNNEMDGSGYGDMSDIMSFASSSWTKTNAPHLWQMRWLPQAQFIEGETLETGLYQLASLDALTSFQPLVYRFPNTSTFSRETNETQPLNKAYFLSLRTWGDPYALALPESYTYRLTIHHYLRRYQACAGFGCDFLRHSGQVTGLVTWLDPGTQFELPDHVLTVLNFTSSTLTFHLQTSTRVLPPALEPSNTRGLAFWLLIVIISGFLLFLMCIATVCYRRQSRPLPAGAVELELELPEDLPPAFPPLEIPV